MDFLLKVSIFLVFCAIPSFATPDFKSICPRFDNAQPMANLDYDKFDGTWYVIKRDKNRFEPKGIKCPTETYTYRSDGVYDILYHNRDGNGMHAITGIITLSDDPAIGIAQLEPEFGGGEYYMKIIDTDYENWSVNYICGYDPDGDLMEIFSVRSRFQELEKQYIDETDKALQDSKVDPKKMDAYKHKGNC